MLAPAYFGRPAVQSLQGGLDGVHVVVGESLAEVWQGPFALTVRPCTPLGVAERGDRRTDLKEIGRVGFGARLAARTNMGCYGTMQVPHCDAKAEVEEYLKQQLPGK